MTPSARLLVLEDDEGLRTSLSLVMQAGGYDVHEAADAETALSVVDDPGVDVMLVDLMLGGIDGFSFIRRARPRTDAPIVVISARDQLDDIVSALEAGADDYITKPFAVEEVQARLRALLRRPVLGTPGEVRDDESVTLDSEIGPLVFDPAAATLRRGGDEIHLTQTEFRLLAVLVENRGRVLSRGVLLENVWDQGFYGDERIVDVHVRRLRKKVERDPASPGLVVTVRGLGYRLDAG